MLLTLALALPATLGERRMCLAYRRGVFTISYGFERQHSNGAINPLGWPFVQGQYGFVGLWMMPPSDGRADR